MCRVFNDAEPGGQLIRTAMQLDIHLCQSFLYPLNMSARTSHQIIALPPIGPRRTDLLCWPK